MITFSIRSLCWVSHYLVDEKLNAQKQHNRHKSKAEFPEANDYLNRWWEDLPFWIQTAFETLGYDRETWDEDDAPASEDMYWNELPFDMQRAALSIGYTRESWDESR